MQPRVNDHKEVETYHRPKLYRFTWKSSQPEEQGDDRHVKKDKSPPRALVGQGAKHE